MSIEHEPKQSRPHEGPPTLTPRQTRAWTDFLWRGVLGCVIVGVLVAGAMYFTRKDHAPAPQTSAASAYAIPISVRVIEPYDAPIVAEYLAQTEASETVQLRARVNGFLVERGFADGDNIEKDQVLFRIETTPFEVALRREEAGLEAALAQLVRADQQVRRFTELASKQQAAQNELELAQEAQRIAAASVETQRALIEQAKLDLGYTTIKSPINGVVGARRQDVGSLVGPNADPVLATVFNVDPLYVRYSVSESDLLRWQRLQEDGMVAEVNLADLVVEIVLQDDRIFPYKGSIDYIDVTVDPSTGTALIRSSVPNPNHTLRPGQFVHARVTGITRLGAIVVPQASVLHTPNGTSVYVVDDADTIQARPVVLGEWTGTDWIVESGLNAGDRVALDHLMQIRPGTKVVPTIVPANTAVDAIAP